MKACGFVLPSSCSSFCPACQPAASCAPYSAFSEREVSHTRVDTHRNLGEDVEDEREDRHVHLDPLAPESLLQVLRHCDHTSGNVHGDENPAEGQKQPGCLGKEGRRGVHILDADAAVSPPRRRCRAEGSPEQGGEGPGSDLSAV